MPSYELSTFAESDLDKVLQYSFERFGENQMLKYNAQLMSCFDEISKISGHYKKIERKGKTLRSLHCPKHYIFALERGDQPLLIIAILHERMDLTIRIQNRLVKTI